MRATFATCLLTLVTVVLPANAQDPSPWQSDWNAAFKIARDEKRLVFVDYFATWCGPCRMMEAKVFVLPEIRERLADFVLLRIDVDKSNVGRTQKVRALPTYVVYDPHERERFRIIGEKPAAGFGGALDAIRSVAPKFIRASDLFDEKKDFDAEFLVGNTYSHLGLAELARDAYGRAHKIADRSGAKGSAQLADALSAFTFAREGNPARALKLLQKLAANPIDRDAEALIWLTIGNVHRAAANPAAAIEAYRRAQSIAAPGSMTSKEAAAAIAALQH